MTRLVRIGDAALCRAYDKGMPVAAKDELARVLGAEPPASVRGLPAATLSRLAAQVEQAKAAQDAEMEKSVRVAIAGVPFAVRGIVRKALLG